jgi:hypothetical protein
VQKASQKKILTLSLPPFRSLESFLTSSFSHLPITRSFPTSQALPGPTSNYLPPSLPTSLNPQAATHYSPSESLKDSNSPPPFPSRHPSRSLLGPPPCLPPPPKPIMMATFETTARVNARESQPESCPTHQRTGPNNFLGWWLVVCVYVPLGEIEKYSFIHPFQDCFT